tara:strand:+ start:571 stop:768 length:198 start_codon:yes stop_codon:yes gene_type:complete
MFNKQEISAGNKKVQSREINQKEKVDINILLNRVREDRKKEKIESTLFITIVSAAVIVVGLIISF